MPLVRISAPTSLSHATLRKLGEGLHRALVETMDVPEDDVFQQVHRLEDSDRWIHPTFPGVQRSGQTVIIEIALVSGRTPQQKAEFYKRTAALFPEIGLPDDDCFIALFDSAIENWSPGKGLAFGKR